MVCNLKRVISSLPTSLSLSFFLLANPPENPTQRSLCNGTYRDEKEETFSTKIRVVSTVELFSGVRVSSGKGLYAREGETRLRFGASR